MDAGSLTVRAAKRLRAQMPAPLATPAYRQLWLSSLLYYHANHFEMITAGWVVLQLTGSPLGVGVLGFCRAIPMFLLGLVISAVADRYRRADVLLTVQGLGFLAAVTLTALFGTGAVHLWHIYLLTGVLGCAWATDYSTRRALITEIVAREHLVNAISLEAVSMQGNKVVATLISGLILATGGATWCYGWLTLMYGLNLLAVARLRRSLSTASAQRPQTDIRIRERVQGGWAVAMRTPLVRGVLLITMAMNLLVFPYQQMLPVVARDVLHVGPQQLGILAGADGIGALAVGLALTRKKRHGRPALLFLCGTFLGAAVVILLAVSRLFALSWGLQILAGMCFGAFGAMQSALVLGAVAPELRTRAMGMLAMAIGFGPFGILLAGASSAAVGPMWTLVGMPALALAAMTCIVMRNHALRAG